MDFTDKVTFELILKDGKELAGCNIAWVQEGLLGRGSSMCERAEYGVFRDVSTRHRVCMADDVLESPQGPDPA